MLVRLICGGYVPCGYRLEPVNRRVFLRDKREFGEASEIYQVDYDRPALARELGWRMKLGREKCLHSGTDGTVGCPECGATASEFIGAATQWLDDRDGRCFRLDRELNY